MYLTVCSTDNLIHWFTVPLHAGNTGKRTHVMIAAYDVQRAWVGFWMEIDKGAKMY